MKIRPILKMQKVLYEVAWFGTLWELFRARQDREETWRDCYTKNYLDKELVNTRLLNARGQHEKVWATLERE